MLKVDLSNVWGDLSLPDLLATEQEVFAAHKTLAEGRGPGNDFLGWLELPTFEETEELQRIRRAAERLRADSDLHSLGQMIQQGQRNLFETIVRFAPPRKRTTIEVDWKNLDGLNYLEGKTLDFVEEQAFQGTLSAHVDGGVPNIVLQTDEVDADTLGELFYFFELSCGISAYMLGVNPFNQPGVEFYKKNMFHLLGKPGY